MEKNKYKLGDLTEEYNEINVDGELNDISYLQGINNEKYFQESNSNKNDIDLLRYKICRNNTFAYNKATSRNGERISIAYRTDGDCLVSPSYICFKVVRKDLVLDDYLMLWFRRPVFDKYVRFNSWGSATEFFTYSDFAETEIYLPSIKEQEKIVSQYKTIERRIELLTKINNKFYDLIHLDYLKVTDGIENTKKISEIGEFVRGKNITSSEMVYGEIDVISAGLLPSGKHNKWNVQGDSITISSSGANAGYFSLHYENIWAADCSYCNKTKYLLFLFESLKSVKDKIEGLKDGHSAQPHVYPKDVNEFLVKFPNDEIVSAFEDKADKIARVIADNLREIDRLLKIKNLFICEL